MWIPIVAALALTALAVVRGAWLLAAAAWVFFGIGAILGGDGLATLPILAGVVFLLIGALSMTRGAIFEGSPKAALSEAKPSMFKGENWDHDPDMESVNFTHRFWGP